MTTSSNTIDTVARAEATSSNSSEVVARAARNNLPDENTLAITRDIIKYSESLSEEDLCICLISGGGSALLCDPVVPLQDMVDTIKLLTSHSATIQQLNTVRTYLCKVKGGGLAGSISPATIISLIISDVIGDPINFIASGPTLPNKVTRNYVIRTLAELSVTSTQLPQSVQDLLHCEHTSGSSCGNDIYNLIIASNKVALDIASRVSESEGYSPFIITDTLDGEARDVARELMECVATPSEDKQYEHISPQTFGKIRSALSSKHNDIGKRCLIFGGETTVTLRGQGLGGRCQEMALSAALILGQVDTSYKITFLATSTDGQDGPTDASGAVITQDTASQALQQGLDMGAFLEGSDSYRFFSLLNGGDNQLKSGLTGTNLMDIIFIFIDL